MNSLSLWRKNKELFAGIQSKTGIKIFVFLLAILQSRTICLYKCRDKIVSNTKKESKYASLIRLFKSSQIDLMIKGICLIIIALLFENSSSTTLIMDRTNWKYGLRHINVLVLGFLWNNEVFIPICWRELGEKRKRGNSNYQDRQALIEQFLELMGMQASSFILLADREFIGADYWAFMKEKGLNFVIRLREYAYYALYSAEFKVSKEKARNFVEKEILAKGICVFYIVLKEQKYKIVILPNKKKHKSEGDYIFLASTLENDEQISAYYAYRWKIESCFKHLKSNGFEIEDIAFKDKEKIELAFAFVSLAYAYAIKEGIIERQNLGKIPKRRYKNKKNPKQTVQYPEISLFRLGYVCVQNQIEKASFDEFLMQNKNKIISINDRRYKIKLISV